MPCLRACVRGFVHPLILLVARTAAAMAWVAWGLVALHAALALCAINALLTVRL